VKGSFDLSILWGTITLTLFFYVWIKVWLPISDLLWPALESVENGTTIALLFKLMPLLLAFMIFVWPYLQAKWKQQQEILQYYYGGR